MKINRILSKKFGDVITIGPDETIKAVVDRLSHYNIGALVVVDESGRLAGIVSERDIIRRLAREEDVLSLTVAEVMTRDVVTGMPQDDVMSVANTMTERRFRHLPIVDEQKLVGIVSIGDVLKFQRDKYRGEIDTLETQILADES